MARHAASLGGWLVAIALIVGLAGGTAAGDDEAATAPATQKAALDPSLIALIGKQDLKRDAMTDILIANGGLRVFDEFWGYAVVGQALDAAGLKLKPEDLQAVKDQLTARVAVPGTTLKKEEKDKLLLQMLAQRGIGTAAQVDWYFGTYAGLQLLAKHSAEAATLDTDQKAAQWRAAQVTKLKRQSLRQVWINDAVLAGQFRGMIEQLRKAGADMGDPWVNTAPASGTAVPPAEAVIAQVGGTTLRRAGMINILMSVGGLRVFDEYWGYAAVMQALQDAQLEIKQGDVQAAKDQLSAKLAPGKALTRKEQDKLILDSLIQNGIGTKVQSEWYLSTYVGLQLLGGADADPRGPGGEKAAAAWRADFLGKLKAQSLPNVQVNDPILGAQFEAMAKQMQGAERGPGDGKR